MYSAKDIAIWFLYKNKAQQREYLASNDDYEVYEGITHLKLQKLLYNAQGVHLAINNTPLFSEPLEAWEHGPVVRDVYDIYCVFGRMPIVIPATEENNTIVNKIESDEKILETLELVYENFSIYTAWQLREMSHVKGGPWDITTKNTVIDNEVIKKYFKEEVVED